jgi:hypothetical protein
MNKANCRNIVIPNINKNITRISVCKILKILYQYANILFRYIMSRHENKPTTPTKAPNTPPSTSIVFPSPLSAVAMLVALVEPPLAVLVPAPVATVSLLETVPAVLPVPDVMTAVVEDSKVGTAPPEVESSPEGRVIVPIPLHRTFEYEDNITTSSSVSCAGQYVE